MKLWLIRPKKPYGEYKRKNDPWDPWYDKAFGFVIRADTEEIARGLADSHGSDERCQRDVWLNPKYSTCKELKPEGKPSIIMRDFHAA